MIKAWMMKGNSGRNDWLTGWLYRKSITLSRASGAVTDYQMIAYIGESERFSPHNMTSNILPAPFIASASTELKDAFRAFDGTTGNAWIANATTGWLKIYSGGLRPRRLTSYTIIGSNTGEPAGNRSPKAWTVQGSNDDTNWTTVDTVTNETGWGASESRTYICDSPSSTAFSYYKIDITENNGDVGYVSITEWYLNGPDSSCAGKGETDFSDLRFTASDGTTLLDYWIESISGSTPNQIATVWIKFNSIGTDATTFYMYYGNSGASAYSNGDNTFLIFDDFSGSFPGSKWDGTTARGSVSSGVLTVTNNGTWAGFASVATTGVANCRLRGNVKTNSLVSTWGLSDTNNLSPTHFNRIFSIGTAIRIGSKDGATASDTANTTLTRNAYKNIDMYVLGGTNMRVFENGSECSLSPKTTNPSNSTGLKISFWAGDSTTGASILVEWIFVAKYESVEPAWGAWGAEES